jgi:hypothetical protein
MLVRIKTPGVDASQLIALAKTAIPLYQAFGGARIRLLRNVDDPSQFMQVVEYELDETIELNRQKIASDPMMRNYLQTWRTLLQAPVEIDVYEDVTS